MDERSADREETLDGSAISDWPEIPEVTEDKIGVPNKFGKQHSLQDLFAGKKADGHVVPAFQRGRSNSDGAALPLVKSIPSTPNAPLDKWSIYADASRQPSQEESLEQKFTSLALACTIDAATIKDRCERQRRNRDQTESNFNLEIEKLKVKLALLQPLCTDFETADLLSTLYAQVDTLTRAASLVAIAAERYGAVQHEDRLTESVQLMVSHVQALKQQRDSARRQLQYTKRVLQEPVQPSTFNPTNQKTFSGLNKKLISKRRASTDSVNFNGQSADNFKLNRRISDVSFRASLTKTRPSRLDLGMELNKIKEMASDEGSKDECYKTVETPPNIANEEFDSDDPDAKISPDQVHCKANEFSHVLRLKFSTYAEEIQKRLSQVFNKWSENGYLHAFLNSCAILCFSVSVLTLVSILLEQEYAKGPVQWIFPWLNRKD